MGDCMKGQTLLLWSDFIDIEITPLNLKNANSSRKIIEVATEAFYDWFKKDDVEAIGSEIEMALAEAGFAENIDYVMTFERDDEEY